MSQKNNNSEKEGGTGCKNWFTIPIQWWPDPLPLFSSRLPWSVCSVFLLFTFCFGFFLLFLNCSTVVASWALFIFSSASYLRLVCSGTRVTARPDRDGGGEGFLQILFPRLLLCTTPQRKKVTTLQQTQKREGFLLILFFSAQHRVWTRSHVSETASQS